jgi:glucose-1-phosphate cytidylyltransferase
MKVVIFCGGRGSRIRDISEAVPKPMLPIGGMPILWHIMKLYAVYGLNEFVLCLGYKGWMIKEFFLNYRAMVSDFTITLGNHEDIEFHQDPEEARWKITLAETGENTYTGGRLVRVRPYLEENDHFCLTYGDGVADINIKDLVEFHRKSGLVGTITGVKRSGRFGEMRVTEGRVTYFDEKPPGTAGNVNGGFMVFDAKRVWNYFDNRDDLWLEREPLQAMVKDGQLGVYEHDGYWQCMDTPREYDMLNEIWETGKAQWRVW